MFISETKICNCSSWTTLTTHLCVPSSPVPSGSIQQLASVTDYSSIRFHLYGTEREQAEDPASNCTHFSAGISLLLLSFLPSRSALPDTHQPSSHYPLTYTIPVRWILCSHPSTRAKEHWLMPQQRKCAVYFTLWFNHTEHFESPCCSMAERSI